MQRPLSERLQHLVCLDIRRDRYFGLMGSRNYIDYPELWPELLENLLKFITEGTDTQTSGALHVLNG